MKFRKIFAAVTAAAVCLTISSCGKQLPEPETASKEHVYREERIKLQELPETIEAKFYSDGKVYIIGTFSQSEGDAYENIKWSSETRLRIVNLEGETELDVPICSREGGAENFFGTRNIKRACPDADGGIVTIDESREKNSYGEYGSVYCLVRYSAEGEKLSEANLEKVMEELDADSLFICGMTTTEDGLYMLALDKSIAVIDKDGRLIANITDGTLPENTRFYGFVTTADGRIFTSYNTYEIEDGEYVGKIFLAELDVPNKKFGEKYQVASPDFISGNDKYDLFVVRESGLAGYDIETGETETVIDWLKSGFDRTAMPEDAVNVLPDGRILCFTYDYTCEGDSGFSYDYSDMVLALLTEIPPEEVPDKKLVKLYALEISDGIRRRIVEFNKNSLEYEVELTSYADYIDGTDRMNIDMVSGNIPDIILLGNFFSCGAPVENYIAKGLFADIYKFIDKDPNMERSDFLENVFKAYEVNGKLYEIAPDFIIQTVVCKTELVGSERGWTVDEFLDFVDSHPKSRSFDPTWTSDHALQTFISNCYESFIDMEKGKCSFDSEEFIRLLEFCGSFPDEIPESFYDDYNYYTDVLPELKSGGQLFEFQQVSDCLALRYEEKGYFGDEITFKGFPSNTGNGSSIQGEKSFAITSKAANPEGAWQFVRYFLTEEYQDTFVNMNQYHMLPLRVSSLEKQAAACRERPYYIGADGEKYYYDTTFYNGVNIGVNTDEDNEKMLDFIKSVSSVYREDKFVLAIVEEEAGAYFAEQKSAKDAAEIIQNRVQNYLDENR